MEPQPSDHGRPPNTRDLACGGVSILLWIVPAIILAVTAIHGGPYLVVVWPVLLTFMGAACLLNAKRCGRLHCFVTGPLSVAKTRSDRDSLTFPRLDGSCVA